jgi:hypothetical protein
LDHRLAFDVNEGFSRKAGRCIPRGYDADDVNQNFKELSLENRRFRIQVKTEVLLTFKVVPSSPTTSTIWPLSTNSPRV